MDQQVQFPPSYSSFSRSSWCSCSERGCRGTGGAGGCGAALPPGGGTAQSMPSAAIWSVSSRPLLDLVFENYMPSRTVPGSFSPSTTTSAAGPRGTGRCPSVLVRAKRILFTNLDLL